MQIFRPLRLNPRSALLTASNSNALSTGSTALSRPVHRPVAPTGSLFPSQPATKDPLSTQAQNKGFSVIGLLATVPGVPQPSRPAPGRARPVMETSGLRIRHQLSNALQRYWTGRHLPRNERGMRLQVTASLRKEGTKRAVPEELLKAAELPSMSVLKNSAGEPYVKTPRRGRGTFGKGSLAVDREGHLRFIKTLRLPEAHARDLCDEAKRQRAHEKARASGHLARFKYPATQATPRDHIIREVIYSQIGEPRCRIHDVVLHRGRMHIIMDAALCSAEVVARGLKEGRQAIGRRLFADVARSLERCHGERIAHRDIKLENILVDENSGFWLADFGLADKVDGRGLKGRAGSHVAPEQMLPQHLGGRKRYGLSVDIWGLALTVADFHVPLFGPEGCPLQILQKALMEFDRRAADMPAWERAEITSLIDEVLSEFEIWRQGLLDAHGRIDVDRIGRPDLVLSPRAAKLEAYFGKLRDADRQLCQFLLESMLRTDPAERASVADVVRRAEELVESEAADDRERGRKTFDAFAAPILKRQGEVHRQLRAGMKLAEAHEL